MSRKELIRRYDEQNDRFKVEDLERKCSVGPNGHVFLFTETMGDPICRIRNSPSYTMLVAELNNEIIGVIQGSIKVVTLHKPPKDLAKVGYILGLRVSPQHRRNGIGYRLVQNLEQWFIINQADYAYMATEKNNHASVNLFVNKLSYAKFRTPTILVNPVNKSLLGISSNTLITKLKEDQAEYMYRKFMSSAEFFPKDIDKVLRNRLSLGTWIAYPRSGIGFSESGKVLPESWAMVSVWNSGELFKMRIGRAKFSCWLYGKISRFTARVFPCFAALPETVKPFGFYFVYGAYGVGPAARKMVSGLWKFVHNMAAAAAAEFNECKFIVTEIGDRDELKIYIPHWKLLSSAEDLWCIRELKRNDEDDDDDGVLCELRAKGSINRALFVDPREV